MTRSNLHTTNPTTSCPYMRDVMTAMVYRATLPKLDVVSVWGKRGLKGPVLVIIYTC